MVKALNWFSKELLCLMKEGKCCWFCRRTGSGREQINSGLVTNERATEPIHHGHKPLLYNCVFVLMNPFGRGSPVVVVVLLSRVRTSVSTSATFIGYYVIHSMLFQCSTGYFKFNYLLHGVVVVTSIWDTLPRKSSDFTVGGRYEDGWPPPFP